MKICDNGIRRDMTQEEEAYFGTRTTNFPTEDELKEILKRPEVHKALELENVADITNFCV